MSIRVAIVEDDQAVRENLSLLVNSAPGFECVALYSTGEQALARIVLDRPEVVLMDLHLPGCSGISCVSRLQALVPGTHVIMLTVEEDTERVFDSLKAGATGYLVKHADPREILDAIREVHRGGAPMSSHIARKVVTAFREPVRDGSLALKLSPREEDVVRLLAKGLRSKEIAAELNLSIGTVNTHVRHIYEKLHVRSRAEAVAKMVNF